MFLTFFLFIIISISFNAEESVSNHELPNPDFFLNQIFNNTEEINLKCKQLII